MSGVRGAHASAARANDLRSEPATHAGKSAMECEFFAGSLGFEAPSGVGETQSRGDAKTQEK